jgi:alkylated DNA repair dioxygenase AlkB
MRDQLDMFGAAAAGPALPDGFRYQPELLTRDEERALLEEFRALPFREFQFHGYTGKRRVVVYGWRYDFENRTLHRTDDMPAFLLALRERAAAFAGVAPERLRHALVTEYGAGAGIGWHRDKDVFGDVIGISLLSSCTFRLRRAAGGPAGASWERVSITAEPRSAYLLRGASRTEWEHSIPPVDADRYSVTFRDLRVER